MHLKCKTSSPSHVYSKQSRPGPSRLHSYNITKSTEDMRWVGMEWNGRGSGSG